MQISQVRQRLCGYFLTETSVQLLPCSLRTTPARAISSSQISLPVDWQESAAVSRHLTTPIFKRHSHFWAGVKIVGKREAVKLARQSGAIRPAKNQQLPLATESRQMRNLSPLPVTNYPSFSIEKFITNSGQIKLCSRIFTPTPARPSCSI